MNKIKGFVLIGLALASSLAFADEVDARAELIASLYVVVTNVILFLGLGLMILGAVKMKRRAENPNDARSFPMAIFITFLSGALMFNYSTTSGTLITSLLGEGTGHCFIFSDKADGNLDINTNDSNCWSAENSDELGELVSRVEEFSGGAGGILQRNAEVIVGLFQLLGIIYMAVGIYNLKQTSEGNSRDGYMKPIVTIITSALIIDLPHTLEMLQETIELIGFSSGA